MGTKRGPEKVGRSALAALVCAVAAVPAVTWWLVGDISEAEGSDYMFRTPDTLERQQHLIGGLATLVLVASLLVILSPAGRQSLQRHAVKTALPLVALGLFLGSAYRVMTAAVVGANIGGGLAFMFGVVFVPSMLILAIIEHRQGRSSRKQSMCSLGAHERFSG